jgi:hypothetical protein
MGMQVKNIGCHKSDDDIVISYYDYDLNNYTEIALSQVLAEKLHKELTGAIK